MTLLFFGSNNFSITTLKPLLNSPLISHLHVVHPPPAIESGTHNKLVHTTMEIFLNQLDPNIYPNLSYSFCPVDPRDKKLENWEIPRLDQISGSTINNNLLKSPFDFGVVSSFGYFIPERIIDLFPSGLWNIHPSILPSYRGAAPIENTLLNGDPSTGVSLIQVSPIGWDLGEIYAQKKMAINPTDTYFDLESKLGLLGSELILNSISNIQNISSKPQELFNTDIAPSKAPKPRKTLINLTKWDSLSKSTIFNRWRALSHSYHLYSIISTTLFHFPKIKKISISNSKTILLLKISLSSNLKKEIEANFESIPDGINMIQTIPNGMVFWLPRSKAVIAKTNTDQKNPEIPDHFLSLDEVQYAGKRKMSALSFSSGLKMGGSKGYSLQRFLTICLQTDQPQSQLKWPCIGD